MQLLLDTNAFLFWTSGGKKLSPRAKKLMSSPRNELLLSSISSLEIAIKHALGTLKLPEPPRKFVPSRLSAHSIAGLPFEHADALLVADLPPIHDDPFDRALIAQAIERELAIITADDRFEEYGVRVEW